MEWLLEVAHAPLPLGLISWVSRKHGTATFHSDLKLSNEQWQFTTGCPKLVATGCVTWKCDVEV
jgi:hypothetical protein